MQKSEIELEKVTMKLYKGDAARLRQLYPANGASKIVRELIHNHIRAVEEEAQRLMPTIPFVNVDI